MTNRQLLFTAITFLAFTLLVAVVSSLIVRKSDDQKTSRGYFLAGNGLGGFFIAGSMLLTNLSAENLVGLSGQSYTQNMSGMAWEATAVIATVVMAFVFLPMYLRRGYTTLPEFMEDRYGVAVRRMVSILFMVGYLLIGIPVCLYAGAIGFNQIFDLNTLLGVDTHVGITVLIIAIGVVGALYAVLGGLRAVAVSDSINGILLVLGAALVVVFGFIAVGQASGNGGFVGGISYVLDHNYDQLNAIGSKTDSVPFACIFTGMLLANLFYWGTNQVLIQRCLGAKNLKEGQKGVLLSGFLKMMVPLFLVLPGVIAAAYLSLGGITVDSSDYAYPTLVAYALPWPLKGLFCAALFGSVISTYNSFLNAASTIFMVDIFKPVFRPNLSEEKTVKYAKAVGWLFAAFAICFTPFLRFATGLYDFGRSFTGFYNIPIITLVLVGMFWKRGSTLGACCATVWHLIFYSGFKFWFQYVPGLKWISGINYMHIYAISFLVMLGMIAVCGRIAPNHRVFDRGLQKDPGYDMRPWKHKNAVAIWLLSFLVYEYFLFSKAGLAAASKNIPLIAAVTGALAVETVVLLLLEGMRRNKRMTAVE